MKTVIVYGIAMLAGCGSSSPHSTDVKATLVIADQSDADITHLLDAAGGTDMFSAIGQAQGFSDASDPCPTAAVSGSSVTYTSGCTTQTGEMIAGSATIDNPESDSRVQYNFQNPTTYTFDALAITESGITQTLDGTVEQKLTSYDADLTVTDSTGKAFRSDIYYGCSQTATSCSLEGSGIDIIGVGGVLASGTVKLSGQTESASYTLKGVDTLTANVTAGCVSWQIAGTSRMMACP